MSTILKTLKKLEEEKSVLEKRLDLKDMVLQDEDSPYSVFSLNNSPRFIWGGALFLTGVVVTVFCLWVDKPQNIQISDITPTSPVKLQSPVQKKRQASSSSVPGIPLSNIPEQPRPQANNKARMGNNDYILEKEFPDNRLMEFETPAADILGGTVREEQGIHEIQSLIASAKSLANEPDDIFTPKINKNLIIPGLKVKGVIFFSSESPSNHIFVSTPIISNQKVRVGDSIESATLLKIESNGAIFSYQGESVHLRIGE